MMPSLGSFECSLELVDPNVKLQEIDTTYHPSGLKTFVVIPRRSAPFQICFRHTDYVSPGISVWVFVDGELHCWRTLMGLSPASRKHKPMVFTGKEELIHGTDFERVYRPWQFAKVNIVPDCYARLIDRRDNRDIGTIEVLVLRCSRRDELPRSVRTFCLPGGRRFIDRDPHPMRVQLSNIHAAMRRRRGLHSSSSSDWDADSRQDRDSDAEDESYGDDSSDSHYERKKPEPRGIISTPRRRRKRPCRRVSFDSAFSSSSSSFPSCASSSASSTRSPPRKSRKKNAKGKTKKGSKREEPPSDSSPDSSTSSTNDATRGSSGSEESSQKKTTNILDEQSSYHSETEALSESQGESSSKAPDAGDWGGGFFNNDQDASTGADTDTGGGAEMTWDGAGDEPDEDYYRRRRRSARENRNGRSAEEQIKHADTEKTTAGPTLLYPAPATAEMPGSHAQYPSFTYVSQPPGYPPYAGPHFPHQPYHQSFGSTGPVYPHNHYPHTTYGVPMQYTAYPQYVVPNVEGTRPHDNVVHDIADLKAKENNGKLHRSSVMGDTIQDTSNKRLSDLIGDKSGRQTTSSDSSLYSLQVPKKKSQSRRKKKHVSKRHERRSRTQRSESSDENRESEIEALRRRLESLLPGPKPGCGRDSGVQKTSHKGKKPDEESIMSSKDKDLGGKEISSLFHIPPGNKDEDLSSLGADEGSASIYGNHNEESESSEEEDPTEQKYGTPVKPYWQQDMPTTTVPPHSRSTGLSLPKPQPHTISEGMARSRGIKYHVGLGGGKLRRYFEPTGVVYWDSPTEPFAVFTFHYRTRDGLKKILGCDVGETQQERRCRLASLSKAELVELAMMRDGV